MNKPLVKKYKEIEVQYNQPDSYNLDIIIPSYNDKQGLIRTLNSLYDSTILDWVSITIVDDCSNFNYEEIIQQFPKINLIK
jgi:glycosyltransferase involved in cell wall biosynthesis